MRTRRSFFGTLFRSVATAAALPYAGNLVAQTDPPAGKWIPAKDWLQAIDDGTPWTWDEVKREWRRMPVTTRASFVCNGGTHHFVTIENGIITDWDEVAS